MKIFAENKKAHFKYEVLEKFEAGISLVGQEVKSIKGGRINLSGSHIIAKNGEVFLIGANIPPYQPKNIIGNYNPERERKLLLTKKEISYLIGKKEQKGLTLVPLMVYDKKGFIKVQFGLAKGLKIFSKKEVLKKKDLALDLRRELKKYQ